MEFGAHLPLIDLEDTWRGGVPDLHGYARDASQLGFTHLCANDHLVFQRPWLDGLAALASVVHDSGSMTLMTTVALPTIRGAAALAKTLGAIDLLSGGRVVAGLGPGSSQRDYTLAGHRFEERWPRFERAVADFRASLTPDGHPGTGEVLAPLPRGGAGIPVWIGSWGSAAGLRRVARQADGWLASAYNTNPAAFGQARRDLADHVAAAGKDPAAFPNALGTMWTYVTDDAAEATRYLDLLGALLNRPADALSALVLVGPAEACATRIRQYAEQGLERLFIWPLADERAQLGRFATRVAPLVRE